MLAHLTSNMFKRDNYYLFSLVRMPSENLTFVGLFGSWFRLPASLPRLPEKKAN